MIADRKKFVLIGIDEAGRGPLAGPISVAAVMKIVEKKNYMKLSGRNDLCSLGKDKKLKGIKDSKKLSAKQREEWLEVIKRNFEYRVAMVGSQIIDRIGINRATYLAVARVLHKLSMSNTHSLVLLDGSLRAPKNYDQEAIIKGDERIPLISAASVVAKVYRDRKMWKFHQLFPEYGFNKHKGYGTRLHYEKIAQNGLCLYHRRSYLKRLVVRGSNY
ncbi:MAG: ribonuclease HII [Patescibacteria group bacterium]